MSLTAGDRVKVQYREEQPREAVLLDPAPYGIKPGMVRVQWVDTGEPAYVRASLIHLVDRVVTRV
jgi:hypothetical protein